MSFLSKVQTGFKQGPQLYVLHSQPGVGKTTFACKFPTPIVADLENGSKHIDVTRLSAADLPNYKSLLSFIEELSATKHPHKTLVIDSATVLESYIHRHICGDKYDSIEEVAGGFGKGFTASREELQKLMQTLRSLTSKMDVVICAHSQIKPFTDPVNNSTYDRWIIQANAKFAEILTSQADNIFFLKHDIATAVDGKTKKTQAFSSGERKLMTEWNAAYEAKNRLNLPTELPLDYQAFEQALESAKPKSAADLLVDIKALVAKAPADLQALAKEKVAAAGNDVAALVRIKQKLASMVVVA